MAISKMIGLCEVQVLQPTVVGSERERKLSPARDKDDDDEIRVSHSCFQLLRRSETKLQFFRIFL